MRDAIPSPNAAAPATQPKALPPRLLIPPRAGTTAEAIKFGAALCPPVILPAPDGDTAAALELMHAVEDVAGASLLLVRANEKRPVDAWRS